jgi:hypothetical protein
MRELTVVDVDGLTLVLSNGEDKNYRVTVDEATLQRLRAARSPHDGPRVSPKEIQARIRAGLSAEEVAAVTGASVETVQRFEGPVLAEREYILNTALAVATHTSIETEDGQTTSAFGAVIRSRLSGLGASSQRWASWKEEDGSWVIKVEFSANAIEHDARWSFEPRKHALTPLNSDAGSLSQKGDLSSGLIPRLRAVDTGAQTPAAEAPVAEPGAAANGAPDNVFTLIAESAATHASERMSPSAATEEHSPTADLLEALRKRRTERESTPAWLRESVTVEETVNIVENDLGEMMGAVTINIDETIAFTEPFERDVIEEALEVSEPKPQPHDSGRVSRSTRPVMPSWDDIVFGTRSDEDPA